jgi:hypothetical protein
MLFKIFLHASITYQLLVFKQIKGFILTIMSTFFLKYVGNPDLAMKHIDGFFFVVNELNRDEIRLYNNFMVYKAWAKILSLKRTLYLNDSGVIKCLFRNLSDSYVQGKEDMRDNFYVLFIFFFLNL